MQQWIFIIAVLILLCMGCTTSYNLRTFPEELTAEVLVQAKTYLDVPYVWGGQSYTGIDCSGLVIEVYAYTLRGTGYTLPFTDTTANNMYKQYTENSTYPFVGGVAFMGNTAEVTHVGIVVAITTDSVTIVDAYSIPAKVVERTLLITDERFLSFGKMLVRF